MIGLILGETKLGKIIINKLKLIDQNFLVIDISKKKIYKKNKNHISLSIGQLGKAISILKKNNCKKIIFAGKVSRPNFSKIKLDFKFLYNLPKIIKSSKRGDAALIKEFLKIFKKEGFKVLNSTYFNPELVLKKGNYTKIKPNSSNKEDITKAKNIIRDLGKHDIGQGVIVRKGYVITIEGPEGTDPMLSRALKLIKRLSNKNDRHGILLKFPKSKQDLRTDLPTVGIKTIRKCSKIGLKGIVLKAGKNIFLDKEKSINLANKNNMFISVI
tara:strand:+ start:3706 stop:4518 length:813 start_codon:yes stop_codon:yes gene_type:complete